VYRIPIDSFPKPTLRRHKQELTMVPKDVFHAKESFFLAYDIEDGMFCVPRWYGMRHFGTAEQDDTQEGVPLRDGADHFVGTLLPHQRTTTDSVLATMRDDGAASPKGGLVCLGCGLGKTVCAMFVIASMRRRTLVLCHKKFLLEQWAERAAQFLPNATIGVVRQATVSVDADIVFASVQSIYAREYPPDTFKNFGLLCVDEAHHMSAPCMSRALKKLPMRFVLALSATPERRDGLTHLLFDSMGPLLYRMEREPETVLIMRIIYENRGVQRELNDRGGKPAYARMLNTIAEDCVRTRCVSMHMKVLLDQDRHIIVLSDRISQLVVLSEQMLADGMPPELVGMYVGKSKPSERNEACGRRVLMSTFSMAREGLDQPRRDTLVLLSPTTSVEQAVGRILRPNLEKKVPLVVDIVDTFSIFMHMAKKRMRFYIKNRYVTKDVSHNDTSIDITRVYAQATLSQEQ
jgi:superfamily II DNA or RNA helicase